MTEIHCIVDEIPGRGFTARAIGADIFTEGDDLTDLQRQVRDAVSCHFEDAEAAQAHALAHRTRGRDHGTRIPRDGAGLGDRAELP
jgi:hypothetical protein